MTTKKTTTKKTTAKKKGPSFPMYVIEDFCTNKCYVVYGHKEALDKVLSLVDKCLLDMMLQERDTCLDLSDVDIGVWVVSRAAKAERINCVYFEYPEPKYVASFTENK